MNGGVGGHSVGLALQVSSTESTRLETYPIAKKEDAFSVTVGRAGRGGSGQGGVPGQPGDEGKGVPENQIANLVLPDPTVENGYVAHPRALSELPRWAAIRKYHTGAEGGTGGAGGGGEGGRGGDAIGLAYRCSEGSNCSVTMSAHMTAAPRAYFRMPDIQAAGGEGGEHGNSSRTSAANGSDGAVDVIRKF